LFGTTLAGLLAAEEAGAIVQPRAKSVLFLFLFGGPSQLETFDMKPAAPSEIRGPFRSIASRTPGLSICEHLPLLAEQSRRYCAVRTVTHSHNDHNACHYIQTGHPLPPAPRGAAGVDATEKDWPAMGSVIEYLDRRSHDREFPSYAYVPNRLGHIDGYDRSGQYAGWLGNSFNALATEIRKRGPKDNPYFRDCTDDELDFRIRGLEPLPEVSLDRLDRRRSLLEQVDAARRHLDEAQRVQKFDRATQRAMSLLTSTKVRAAFDVRGEPASLRDRYGRHLFGQSALLGRRLIEAGARFVTVLWDGPGVYSWDSHESLTSSLKDHLLPGLDQALSTLLEDLAERGLLDDTLVVCVGEMGRTPKFQNRGSADGRDHWSFCFPCLLAGAGIPGGITLGRSDKDAAFPLDRPVSPEDLACTVFEALGIDPHAHLLNDKQGRPLTLVDGGEALRELFV